MHNSLKVLLCISMIAFSSDSMLMHDFSYATPHYSVTISGIGPADVSILEGKGFLIEWASREVAVVYVDADMEQMLWHLGYNPVPVPMTTPLVPFPTLQEIYDAIDSVVAAHPEICRKVTIGSSVLGRDIEAVVVSDNPYTEEIEPELRINGGIHGDEPAASTTTLHFLEVLTDNYATSPVCQYLVDNTEMWVIPVLNPDGYYYVQRTNGNGVDLNRNCSYMGPGPGGGPYAFSEPETSALRDLTMQDWPLVENFINPFAGGLSLHGGWAFISSPWNYSATAVLQDTLLMLEQCYQYASSGGILAYFGGDFDFFVPGAVIYPSCGDVNDWSYGECGTVDYTVEVYEDFFVPDWPGVANAHYMAIVEFFTGCTYGIWGTVTDNSGNPIDANLDISINEGQDSQLLRFCRTDVTLGDYHKTLLPGTYDVTVTADGYESQSVTDVSVGPEEAVEVSFILSPLGIGDSEGSIPSNEFLGIPNPATSSCSFSIPIQGIGGTIEIYDLAGRCVESSNISTEDDSFLWNLQDRNGVDCPSGIYISRFRTGSSVWNTRVIVSRENM